MQGMRNWFHESDDERSIETLPYRPRPEFAGAPLHGIESFAPEFWKLVSEPTGPVPRATPSQGSALAASPPMEEISIVSKRLITDDEITNILVGETVSLSGPGVEEMRRQMAQSIMNADEAFGTKRDKFAITADTVLDRTLSPAEEKIRQSIHQNVLEARDRYHRGEDPTNRATQFMKREDRGKPPSTEPPARYGTGFRLQSIHGSFKDSQANGALPKHVYFWQSPDADNYYGRDRK